jgi:hypothetical protein
MNVRLVRLRFPIVPRANLFVVVEEVDLPDLVSRPPRIFTEVRVPFGEVQGYRRTIGMVNNCAFHPAERRFDHIQGCDDGWNQLDERPQGLAGALASVLGLMRLTAEIRWFWPNWPPQEFHSWFVAAGAIWIAAGPTKTRSTHPFAIQIARGLTVFRGLDVSSMAQLGRTGTSTIGSGASGKPVTEARRMSTRLSYPRGRARVQARPHPNIKVTTNRLCEARSRGGGSPPRCPRACLLWRPSGSPWRNDPNMATSAAVASQNS